MRELLKVMKSGDFQYAPNTDTAAAALQFAIRKAAFGESVSQQVINTLRDPKKTADMHLSLFALLGKVDTIAADGDVPDILNSIRYLGNLSAASRGLPNPIDAVFGELVEFIPHNVSFDIEPEACGGNDWNGP